MYPFTAIFLHETFGKLPIETQSKFNSRVLQAGILLGTITVFETANTLYWPNVSEKNSEIKKTLGIQNDPSIRLRDTDDFFLFLDVLKQQRTIKGWFRTRTLQLIQLWPFSFLSHVEKISESEGAARFEQKRPKLGVVIETVSRIQVLFIREYKEDHTNDSRVVKFPELLDEAWQEQLAYQSATI